MPKPLSVLNIEDSESDSDLISRLLKKAGYKITLERVETAAQMRAALKKRVWDVIISDHSLPQFDSYTALALLREEGLDIPFIAVSGTIGEEAVVDMMKAGAHDYLMKDNLTRLIPAVERELEQTKIRNERKQIESMYRTLTENSVQGIAIFQGQKMVFANPALSRINGYTNKELMAMSAEQILAITHPHDRAVSQERIKKRMAGETVSPNIELRILRKDGSTGWVQAFTDQIVYEGQPAILSTLIDITESKNTEDALRKSEQKYRSLYALAERREQERALLDNVRTALTHELDLTTILRTVVEAIAKTFGYTLVSLYFIRDETLVLQHQVGYSHVINEIPISQGIVGRVVRSGLPLLIEDVRTDPTFLGAIDDIVSEVCVPLFYQNQIIGLLNVESTQNIKLSEADLNLMVALSEHISPAIGRARLFTAVDENEKRFRALIENSADAIVLLDARGIVIYDSPAAPGMLGYDPDERIGKSIFELIHPDDLIEAQELVQKLVMTTGGRVNGIFRLQHKNNSWRWIEAVAANLLEEPGVKAIVVNYRDITKRKQAEEALHESEERFKSAFQYSAIGMALVSLEGKWLKVNSTLCSIVGYAEDELLTKTFQDITHPDDLDKDLNYLNQVLAGKIKSYKMEKRYFHKEGRLVWVLLAVALARDNAGTPLYFISQIEDITERKQAEAVAFESEARYRSLFEDSPIALWEEDFSAVKKRLDTLRGKGVSNFNEYFNLHPQVAIECASLVKILDVNNTTIKLFGANKKDDLLKDIAELMEDEPIQQFQNELVNIAEGKTSFGWEGVVKTLDGSLRNIDLSWRAVPDIENSLSRVIVSMIDITERKQAEQELRNSELLFRELVDNIDEVFWITEPVSKKDMYVSPAYLKIWGRTLKDAADFVESVQSEDRPNVLNALEKQKHGEKTEIEYRIKHTDGSMRWVWDRAFPIYDSSGKLKSVGGIATDITERKRAEEVLRESEERFRSLFNRMMDGVYRSKHEGKFVDVNPAMVNMFGYSSKEEMLAVDIKNELYFEPEERGSHILDTGQEEMEAYRMRRKDGSEIWVEDHGSYVHDEQGRIIYHEGILRDITERKHTEQILAESELRFRQAIVAADAIPYSLNYASGHYTFIGDGITKLTGYPLEEMTPALLDTLIIESIMYGRFEGLSLEEAVRLVREGDSGVLWRCDHHIRTRAGEEHWISDASIQVLDENGIPNGSIGIIQDITERKQIEANARDGEARYRSLFEDSPISLWEEDFSDVKLRLDALRDEGIKDFRAYFVSRPQVVQECISLVKISNVNKAALKLFGAKAKADLVQNLSGFLNNDSTELFQNELVSIAQGKSHFEGEGVTQTLNGRQIIIKLSLAVIPGYEDTLSKVIISMVDITALIQAEQAIRESENNLRESQMIAGLGSYMLDIPSEKWTSSDILNQILGINESYTHSVESWLALIHPDWQKEMSDYYTNEVIGNHVRFDKEYKIIRNNDGAERWIHGLGELEFDEHNQPVKMRGTIQDITERKQAEIEIKERADEMELINSLNEAVNRGERLDSILKLFAQKLRQISGDNESTFYLLSPDGNNIVMQNLDRSQNSIRKIEQLIGRPIPPIQIPVKEGNYFHRALYSEHGILTSDPETIQSWIAEFTETNYLPSAVRGAIRRLVPQIYKLLNIRSAMAIPLISDKKVIGLFDISSSKILTEKDLNRFQKISGQLTTVILRKQVEQALRESEQRYHALFEDMPVSIWEEDFSVVKKHLDTLKEEGITDFRAYFESNPDAIRECNAMIKVLDVNQAALKMYCADSKEDLLMSVDEVPNERLMKQLHDVLIAISEGKKNYTWEGADETIAGEPIEINLGWSVAPEHEVDFSKVIVTTIDITARKQAEEALQKAEIKYRMLVERLPVVVYTSELGGNGVWPYVSPQIEHMLGFTVEEWMADPGLWYRQVHADDRDRQQKLEEQAWARQEPFEGEYRIFARDGRLIWIRDSAQILPPQNNGLPIVQGVLIDITERKQAEEALRESEQRYRALFEDMPVAIWEEDFSDSKKYLDSLKEQGVTDFRKYFKTNPEAFLECATMIKVLDVNRATLKMYRADSKDDLYKSMDNGLNESEVEHLLDALVAIAEGKTSHGWEGVDQTVTDEPIEVSLNWTVAPGHEVDFSKVIVTTLDITDRKSREREQEALASVTRVLNQSLDLDVLLQNLLDAALHAIPLAEKGAILLLDADNSLRIRALSGYLDPRIRMASFPSTSGYSARAVRELQPLIIADARADAPTRYNQEIKEMEEIQSAIVAPLMVNGRAIGAIALDNASRKEAFGQGDLTTLSTFAASAALVIQNTRLFEETRQRVAELELLYESGLAISQLLSPKEIGQKIIDLLEQKMNWHHTAIRLYNTEDETLELLAFHQPDIKSEAERLAVETRFKAVVSHSGQGVSGWVIQHGKTVRTGDLINDDRYIETFGGLHSGLYVPIKAGERVIGVISIESERENAFSKSDEQLTTILATQAASIFENARLYEDTIQRAEELEQRVAERTAQIEATKRRLELATHAGQIGVWEYNPRENKVIWDERMHMIHQIPPGEFDGTSQTWAQIIHPDDIEQSQINRELAVTKNLLMNNEHRIIWPDGSVRNIMTSAVTAYSAEGIPDRIIGINMDITERKQNEQSLRESENYARLLFDAVGDPVSVTDGDALIVDVNKAFEKQYSLVRDEIRGRRISELGIYPETELEKREKYLSEILQGQPANPVELDFYVAGDRIHTLELHSYLLKVNGRQLVLNTAHDITSHKKAEEIQRLAKSEMERALRIKNEFLANMSHELRTPLNSILGISESLEEQIAGTLNEKQLKYIGIVRESGRHLLELINDILDLSKIEAGRLELDIHKISVETLCQSSLRMVRELSQKKSLQVSFQNKGEITVIRADQRRLKQCLVNLLSNAVKFTPEGKEIGLEVSGNLKTNEVQFTVWDQGVGIVQEDIKLLFKPFVQLDAGLAREYQGTGLGLALVSQMIQLHGGRVSVESEEGKGSRFSITLPWLPNEQTPNAMVTAKLLLPIPKSDEKRNGRILLVEDTDVVVQLITEYLRFKGYEIILAHNGVEGIKLAAQEQPDLILMDVMMPIMDGLEATRTIRTDENLQNIPIIALTALAMSGDSERCLEAGMNDYLSKPIQMQDLADMIEKYLGTTPKGSNEQ